MSRARLGAFMLVIVAAAAAWPVRAASAALRSSPPLSQAEEARAAAWQRRTAAADRWEPDRLRRAIEERYRVIPLRDGVALVPKRETSDVKSIEVSGDTVAINGAAVTGSELRERLQSDSDAILALSYLDPDARRALFEGNQAPSGATPAAPSEEQTPSAAGGESPNARVERRNHSDTRVHIGGPVQVDENESVDGPVVAIGGSVTVNGEVREDVVAVLGDVRLGPKARVLGDVTAVGGTIDRDARAEVEGKTNEIGIHMRPFHFRPSFWWPARGLFARAFGPGIELTATLSRMFLFALLASLVFLIARNPVGHIERTAAVEPWKAALVGVLTEVFFIPLLVLTVVVLAVSIVGIPLLVFLVPLSIVAFMAALVLGFTGIAYRVGRWLEYRFGLTHQAPFVLMLFGLLAIWGLTLVGRLVSFGGFPIWFLSSSLLGVGFFVEYIAWTMGLGAAVMTRFGTRPASGGPPPLVPPVPARSAAGGAA